MEDRRLKKGVIYGIYSLGIVALIGTIYLIESSISNDSFKDEEYTYVSKTIFDDSVPVMSEDTKIIRPYTDPDIKVVKGFYDYKAEGESQQNALFEYEGTYMQSSGISYGGKEDFEVVAILDGTVISVEEDKLLGKVVQIRHSNDMISIYQSLGNVNVKANDEVKQGTIIGTSGTSNIDTSLGKHLYFEIINNGVVINQEDYYDKTINEL